MFNIVHVFWLRAVQKVFFSSAESSNYIVESKQQAPKKGHKNMTEVAPSCLPPFQREGFYCDQLPS